MALPRRRHGTVTPGASLAWSFGPRRDLTLTLAALNWPRTGSGRRPAHLPFGPRCGVRRLCLPCSPRLGPHPEHEAPRELGDNAFIEFFFHERTPSTPAGSTMMGSCGPSSAYIHSVQPLPAPFRTRVSHTH